MRHCYPPQAMWLVVALLVIAGAAGAAPARTKTITIGYSWGWTNIGDAAIAPGLLNLLSKHFPDHELRAVAHGNGKAETIAEHIQRLLPDCQVIDGDRLQEAYRDAYAKALDDFGGELPAFTNDNLDYLFDTFAQNCVDFLREHYHETYEELLNTDLFIYNSGCVLVYGEGTIGGTDFWGYSVPRSLPLLLARRLDTPYGVYSHSFDSLGDDPGYSFFKRLLEDARFVFCRETDSLGYLLSRNIKPKHLQFVPDSTFSSSWHDRHWAESFLQQHDLAARPFIAVVVRTPAQRSARPQISAARAEAHMEKIRGIVEHWVSSAEGKVLLCPEVSREIEAAKTEVFDKLSPLAQRNTVWMDSFWTHDQAKAVYSQAHMVISMELHSVLLALPERTPIIHLPFAEVGRKSQFVADMGLADYLMDIDRSSLEVILEQVDRIHRRREAIVSALADTVVPYGRDLEDNAMKVIKSVIGDE